MVSGTHGLSLAGQAAAACGHSPREVSVVERQIKELLYAVPNEQRPRIAGKTDAEGRPLISALGELRPSRIMAVAAEWLARLNPALDRRHLVVDFTMPSLLSNDADAVKRQPYFCSGCPASAVTSWPAGWSATPAA